MRGSDLPAAIVIAILAVGVVLLSGWGTMWALATLFGTPMGWWPFVACLVLLCFFGSVSSSSRK